MQKLSCIIFVLVFIIITTYLLSLVLVHIFSEKIKEATPQAVIVNVHKKNGKQDNYYISNSTQEYNNIESFTSKKPNKNSNNNKFSLTVPFKQIIKAPKKSSNKKIINKESIEKTDKKVESVKNNKQKKTSITKKDTTKKDNTKKDTIEEGFVGDRYLLEYTKKYNKNTKKLNKKTNSYIAYNNLNYY